MQVLNSLSKLPADAAFDLVVIGAGGAGMAAYLVLDKDPIALVQIAFNSVGSFPLMALPAFIASTPLSTEMSGWLNGPRT